MRYFKNEEKKDRNIADNIPCNDHECQCTYIETTSIAYEQEDNATPVYQSESVNDVEEISESDTSIEVSNQKEVKATSSAKGELLSASNDDVLRADTDCFYYVEAGTWHTDLRDAMDEIADSDTKIGTILVKGGTYTERDATTDGDIYIHFSDAATITIRPFDGEQVIFDGSNTDYLFWFENANCKITFNDISFTKGKATKDGGAIEISEGQLTLNNCVLTGNEGGRYGGAISVSDGGSFIANNCVFTNNKAADRAIKWVTMKTVTKKTILDMKTARAHLEVGSFMIVDLKDMVPLIGNLMLLLNQ